MARKLETKLIAIVFVTSVFPVLAESKSDSGSTDIVNFRASQACYREANRVEDWPEALRCSKASVDIGTKLFGENHKNIATLKYNLGLAFAKNKNYTDSILNLETALDRYKDLFGPESESVGWLLLDLANIELMYGVEDSYRTYQNAFKILSDASFEGALDYAGLMLTASIKLSTTVRTNSAISGAIKIAEEASSIFSSQNDNNVQKNLAALTLGKLNYIKGDYNAAIPQLKQSLKNTSSAPFAHGLLVDIYIKTGRPDLAAEHQAILVNSNDGLAKDYIPIFVPQPKFPRRALSIGKEGYAVVEVTITKSGSTSSPQLVEEYPKNFGFGRSALKAAERLKYAPRFIDGEAQEVPGVLYKFTFSFR